MSNFNAYTIKEIISNLKVDVALAGISNVGPFWKDLNYIPDYNKFYFILDGEGWIKIGDKEFTPKKGELFLMPENVIQSYSITDPQNTFIKCWVHFTAKIGDINLFDIIKTPFSVHVVDTEYVTNIFKKIFYYHIHSELMTDKIMMQSYILQIISYFLENLSPEDIVVKNESDISRILTVIEFIDENISKDITIDDLASLVHLQPNYFINYFKNFMNTSPMHYVKSLRINKAVNLLKLTDYKIKEISIECGFNNELYFSKTFKKLFGITPSDYRKSFKNKISDDK